MGYDLDIKSGVQPSSLRWPAIRADAAPALAAPASGTSGAPTFPIGAAVEYFSATNKNWFPAKIVSYNTAAGTYDLDIKPGVQPSRLRWPAIRADAAPALVAPASGESGALTTNEVEPHEPSSAA